MEKYQHVDELIIIVVSIKFGYRYQTIIQPDQNGRHFENGISNSIYTKEKRLLFKFNFNLFIGSSRQ